MNRRTIILFVAVAFAAVANAAAQQCTPDDTPLSCWNRFNPNVAATAQTVATTNTSTPTPSTQVAASVLRDFMSFFSANAQIGKVSEGSNSVVLDWNLPFPFVQKFGKLKVQTLFNDPEVGADVQKALGSNATALSDAKGTLTNFDDVTTLVSYDFVNGRIGRSIGPHRDLLDALGHAATVDEDKDLLQLAKFSGSLSKVTPKINEGTPFSSITDLATQQSVMHQMENMAKTEQKTAAASLRVVKALAQLINNQPQLYFSGSYHARNSLIGPNEISGKASYEMSPNSLNDFLRKTAVCDQAKMSAELSSQTPAASTQCLSRLLAAVPEADPATAPNANDRFTVSVEYKQIRTETVDLTSLDKTLQPLQRPGSHSFVYSIGWGRPLPMLAGKDTRLDVAVDYNNVSNDPTQKDRLVGTITWSQKISDTLTLPLSLTYANHAEFLPTSNRRLGVHFGISYKIPNAGGS